MRNFIYGVMAGIIITGGVAWAAQRVTLQNGGGTEVGTTANPLYIQGI